MITFTETERDRHKRNLESHELVETGDPEAKPNADGQWPAICDRNGEVVLGFCRRCRGGEAQLENESCLERLLKLAIERESKLSPLQRAINHLEQRRGRVTAEMRMNDDASPNGVTKEQANSRLRDVAPEYIVLDALLELMNRNRDESKPREDGTQRKAHYGSGRQPVDDIRDAGWGPQFFAGNVLKYIRRTKDVEHSLASARVYYDWLNRMCVDQRNTGRGDAIEVLNKLDAMLSSEERALVHEGLTVT